MNNLQSNKADNAVWWNSLTSDEREFALAFSSLSKENKETMLQLMRLWVNGDNEQKEVRGL